MSIHRSSARRWCGAVSRDWCWGRCAAPKVESRFELRVFAANEIKMAAVLARARMGGEGREGLLAKDSFQKFANGFKRNEAGN